MESADAGGAQGAARAVGGVVSDPTTTRKGSSAAVALRTIKALHTVAWAVFAGCIVALPVVAWRRQFAVALVLIAIVAVEVLILLLNRMRCPLTNIAERHTDDRRANFDIYLPEWLARYNKQIFGSLFTLGIAFTVLMWRIEEAQPAASVGAHCELNGPAELRPATLATIRIGMTREQVREILGPPDYSPVDGQDYHSTPGECELETGRMAPCGYVIEYRDYSSATAENTGRVVECRWGAIGE
jgi:hypothetical protein